MCIRDSLLAVLAQHEGQRGIVGEPRLFPVLVAPHARGRGLAAEVGRHAASYAIRDRGLARWAARIGNEPSTRTAARLGFEPYVTQLAVRP